MTQPELYQCPYAKAWRCSMEEPCKGCDTWARAIRKQEDLKRARGSQSEVDGGVRKLGIKEDKRPQRRWWAPGHYCCTCHICGEKFIGDKRAGECADCAYDDIDENAHSF